MKCIIKAQECGFLFKNGVLTGLRFAGRYHIFPRLGEEMKITPMTGKVDTMGLPAELLMEQQAFQKRVLRVRIPDDCVGLHLVDGVCRQILLQGEALYWNVFEKNEIRLVNIMGAEMTEEEMPSIYRRMLPSRLYRRLTVGEGETGLLYIDGRFSRQLSCGTYYYWCYAHEISMKLCSLKVQQLEISGQEILTADKVGVRLNILCSYRITNPLALAQKTDNVANLLYARVQLLAREYIGSFRLDELLARKEEIGRFLADELSGVQEEYCVEILGAGIKDIILPGEIRDIMNTVLVAEKKAQANVIMRREEVASTRSLLNTARLMEENQVLYRLKELEYLERICDRVGSISLNGGGSVLEQLAALTLPKQEQG